MPRPTHLIHFIVPNSIFWCAQIMNLLLITQFSPVCPITLSLLRHMFSLLCCSFHSRDPQIPHPYRTGTIHFFCLILICAFLDAKWNTKRSELPGNYHPPRSVSPSALRPHNSDLLPSSRNIRQIFKGFISYVHTTILPRRLVTRREQAISSHCIYFYFFKDFGSLYDEMHLIKEITIWKPSSTYFWSISLT
jgi:hypothetical protein